MNTSFNPGVMVILMLLAFSAGSNFKEPVMLFTGAATILSAVLYMFSIKKQRPIL